MHGGKNENEKVVVVPYDEMWRTEFEKIKYELSEALGDAALSIEHVGSTSVVGLWAKPIIDIDVVIKDNTELPLVIEKLNSICYHYEGDLGITDRYAFCYENKPHFTAHHLYVCPQNSAELKRHTVFRDYLRNHPEAVEKYSQIKREGAALFPYDIDGYINYKSRVIEDIYGLCGLKTQSDSAESDNAL